MFKSYIRSVAMARISPVSGSITTTPMFSEPVVVIHSSMYFSTTCCTFRSMVETTVLPLTAGLITVSRLESSFR